MTKEEKDIIRRAEEICQREARERWEKQHGPEFTLVHEEDGYRILRRNYGTAQWWLYHGDKLITTSQYRKGAFGALYHILEVKQICLALVEDAQRRAS